MPAEINSKNRQICLQLGAALEKTVNIMKRRQGTRLIGSQEKADCPLQSFSDIRGKRSVSAATDTEPRTPMKLMLGKPTKGEEVMGSMEEPDGSKAVRPEEVHPAIVEPLAEIMMRPPTHLFTASMDKGRVLTDCLTLTVCCSRSFPFVRVQQTFPRVCLILHQLVYGFLFFSDSTSEIGPR